jgi:hypothetical protein
MFEVPTVELIEAVQQSFIIAFEAAIEVIEPYNDVICAAKIISLALITRKIATKLKNWF